MSDLALAEPRRRFATVINHARQEPVALSRLGRKLVAVVDVREFDKAVDAPEEFEDIRVVDGAEELGDTLIPWNQLTSQLRA